MLGLFLLVFALLWVSIQGGGYDPTDRLATTVLTALAFGAFAIAGNESSETSRSVCIVMAIATVWCLLIGLQLLPVPGQLIELVSPWSDDYSRLGVDALSTAGPAKFQRVSLIPADSLDRFATYAFAIVLFLLSNLFLTNKRRRLLMLGGVATGSAAIASWGILQRMIDSRELPPGVPRTNYADYFAAFSNENTGAACVSLGAAAALGLIVWKMARIRRQSQDTADSRELPGLFTYPRNSESSHGPRRRVTSSKGRKRIKDSKTTEEGYRPSVFEWSDPVLITVWCCFLLLVTGIVLSLSRGAILSALVAIAIVLFRVFWSRSWWVATLLVAFAALATYAALLSLDSQEHLVTVSNELNAEKLSLDGRWEHWKDGLALAKRFPIFGSGLGTYGFAQLPTQGEDSIGWVREAHNQYLELFAETGCIGLGLLLIGLVFCLITLWTSLASKASSDVLAVRAAALCAALLVTMHSLVDFSYAAPANLWTFACLLGMALGTTSGTLSSLKTPRLNTSFLGFVIASGILLAYLQFSRNASEDSALAQTQLRDAQMLAPEEARKAILTLDRQSGRPGMPANIGLRKAKILMQQFKRQNFSANIKLADRTPLHASQVRGIEQRYFQRLGQLIVSQQNGTASNSEFADSAELLRIQKLLLETARQNPLQFHAHFLLGQVNTFLAQDGSTWFERCCLLNRARPEMFYANGLFAMWADDSDSMDQQWRRCLTISRKYDSYVLAILSDRLSGQQFAERIAPRQPEKLFAFVRAMNRTPEFEPFREATVSHAISVLKRASILPKGMKANYLGHLLTMTKESELASIEFSLAVKHEPKNISFRLDLASHLALTEYPDLALKQLGVASALAPSNPRVEALIQRIRQQNFHRK